jgi:hypothetical protein
MLSIISLCRQCENGSGAPVWPDGGAILDQPVKLVKVFNLIRSLIPFYLKSR